MLRNMEGGGLAIQNISLSSNTLPLQNNTMLLDAIRHALTRQSITAPKVALGFMGGVVVPILITDAISHNQPNTIYKGKDKGELLSIRYTLQNLNRRITNIHNQIDHIDEFNNDVDVLAFNDLLY